MSAFVFSGLSSNSVSAASVQSTLTLSAVSDLSLDLKPEASGKFSKTSDALVKVRTDNFTGYTISIAAKSSGNNSTSLSDGNGHYIESISSNLSEADFSNAANTQYNNKWGFKPSQYMTTSGTSHTLVPNNTNYLPSPDSTGLLLDITNVANKDTDNTYTISFGARVDYNTPAGTYSNDYEVRVVANNIVYNITYDKNTTDTVSDMPSPNPQATVIQGGTPVAQSKVTLSAATPKRTGYTFMGWCDTATTLDSNTGDQSCSGTTYQVGDPYGIDQTKDGSNIRLYAIWQLNSYDITIKTATGVSAVTITKDNQTVCSTNTTTGEVCHLKNSKTYNLEATISTGYTFNTWNNSTSTGTVTDSSNPSTTFTPGLGNTTLTPSATVNTYIINLDANGGTGGSSSTTATYGATSLGTITNPTKASTTGTRTVSGLAANGTNASGATVTFPSSGNCTSTSNCKSTNTTTYTFNGWHETSTESSTLIASSSTTPALQASTSYTDANSKWTDTSGSVTLYAGYSASAGSYSSVTLPSITKTGYTCGWDTNQSATNPTYSSGGSLTPSGNVTLYGICKANTYTITFDGDSGISNFTVDNSTISKGGTKSLTYGQTYPITINYVSGYEAGTTPLQKNSGQGTVSGTSFTVGAGIATLYANSKLSCAANMQDSYATINALVPNAGDTATLCDARDNNTYTVAKIKGALWMTQNLRITGTVSSTDSNFSTNSSVNVCEGDLTAGDSYDEPRCHDSGNTTNGVWYNYAAASAKTITGSSNTTLDTENICPAGWTLPSYDENAPAGSVNSLLGDESVMTAFSPVTGGRYNYGSLHRPDLGHWWTTVAYGSGSRYYLYYNGSSLRPDYYGRYGGFYVRCVKTPPPTISDATYMQDVTDEMIDNTEEYATATLKDKRDEKEYTVAKIKGALWMTQNLRITGTVSSTDSNFSTYSSVNVCEGDLTAGDSYDQARCHNSGNTTNGVWYNYAAASAKTITGSSNTNEATEDICPAGWHMPNYNTSKPAGSINSLLDDSAALTAFSPVTGGYYGGGSVSSTDSGYWWSTTASSSTGRYRLYYGGSSLNTSSRNRYYGYYIRCVKTLFP